VHYAILADSGHGDHIEVDRARDDTTVVVVGVIARQFASAGHGKDQDLTVVAVLLTKGLNERKKSLLFGRQVCPVQGQKLCVSRTAREYIFEIRDRFHISYILSRRAKGARIAYTALYHKFVNISSVFNIGDGPFTSFFYIGGQGAENIKICLKSHHFA
jgi:hypothetical protein